MTHTQQISGCQITAGFVISGFFFREKQKNTLELNIMKHSVFSVIHLEGGLLGSIVLYIIPSGLCM